MNAPTSFPLEGVAHILMKFSSKLNERSAL